MSICVITKKEKRKRDFVCPLQTCYIGNKKIKGLLCPWGRTGFHGVGVSYQKSEGMGYFAGDNCLVEDWWQVGHERVGDGFLG